MYKRHRTLAVLLAAGLMVSACTAEPAADASDPGNPAKEEALDLSSPGSIDASLEVFRHERLELPAEAENWEGRTLDRYFKNDALVKLAVSTPDDAGRMVGPSEFYFDAEGRLLEARDLLEIHRFANGKLLEVVDATGSLLTLSESEKAAREARILAEADRWAAMEENFGYELSLETWEAENKSIRHPVLKNFRGELLQDYMNQSLSAVVGLFSEETWEAADIGCTVTRRDEDLLSVRFTGTVRLKGLDRDLPVLKSVTLDMAETGNELSPDAFIRDPGGLKSLLETWHGAPLEYEGLAFYLRGTDAVFYFMPPDDSARAFVEIAVPLDQLEPYVSWDFGDRPAS